MAMVFKEMDLLQAVKYLEGMGLVFIPALGSVRCANGRRSALICDYRNLKAFKHAWQIGIYKVVDGFDGDLIERVNVKR